MITGAKHRMLTHPVGFSRIKENPLRILTYLPIPSIVSLLSLCLAWASTDSCLQERRGGSSLAKCKPSYTSFIHPKQSRNPRIGSRKLAKRVLAGLPSVFSPKSSARDSNASHHHKLKLIAPTMSIKDRRLCILTSSLSSPQFPWLGSIRSHPRELLQQLLARGTRRHVNRRWTRRSRSSLIREKIRRRERAKKRGNWMRTCILQMTCGNRWFWRRRRWMELTREQRNLLLDSVQRCCFKSGWLITCSN